MRTDHTFVVPAYKDSPYLEDCIKNLLAQTVQSNVIIVSSTPSDYISRIADKYALAYFIHPERNVGIAGDWNFALSKAETKYVTIAHQDDVYSPNFAEEVLKQMRKKRSGNVLIAFTGYIDLVNGQDRERSLNALVKQILLFPFVFSSSLKSSFFKRSILLFGDPICCPSVTYNKEALGDFRFSENYQCALDWYAWIQLAGIDGSFVYLKKKLMKHRIHAASETTVQIDNGTRKEEELQLLRMLWGKSIGNLVGKVYALGHRGNRI